jgi:LacI family transcriptional regulator
MSAMTLKKIANLLNLSISTVSRALKDHPDISKNTIKRVKEIAESMEYEPNANAIHLKMQDSRLFAVLVPNFSKYFYDSFIAGIEEECRKENYSLMILQNGDDPEIEKLNLKLCRHNRVSGVFVCMCTNSTDFNNYNKLKDNNIPVLFFDKVPETNEYNKVSINDQNASTLAVEWILKNKFKNVLALFGNNQLSITKRRLITFNNKIAPHKVAVNVVHVSSSIEAEEATKKAIEDKKIDSIFCMSDEILIGSMAAIQKQKKGKEKHIEILAMSDGFFPTLYYPKISYIETSGLKLAKSAYIIMKKMIVEKSSVDEYFVEPVLV